MAAFTDAPLDPQQRLAQQRETRETIKALLEDGSNPEAEHILEHHFASDSFDRLEKLAVAAFNLGFEVTDAEELRLDDGALWFCCDVVGEGLLNADLIDSQTDQMMRLAQQHAVQYDGWGTYLEE